MTSVTSEAGNNRREGVHLLLQGPNVGDAILFTPALDIFAHLIHRSDKEMYRVQNLLRWQSPLACDFLGCLLPMTGNSDVEHQSMQFQRIEALTSRFTDP